MKYQLNKYEHFEDGELFTYSPEFDIVVNYDDGELSVYLGDTDITNELTADQQADFIDRHGEAADLAHMDDDDARGDYEYDCWKDAKAERGETLTHSQKVSRCNAEVSKRMAK